MKISHQPSELLPLSVATLYISLSLSLYRSPSLSSGFCPFLCVCLHIGFEVWTISHRQGEENSRKWKFENGKCSLKFSKFVNFYNFVDDGHYMWVCMLVKLKCDVVDWWNIAKKLTIEIENFLLDLIKLSFRVFVKGFAICLQASIHMLCCILSEFVCLIL